MNIRPRLLAYLLLSPLILTAQQLKVSEYQVQAVYLYNFGKFISMPAEIAATKGSDFEICVIGQDPFRQVLDEAVSGETLAGRPVVARHISEPEESGRCRILYVSVSEEGRLGRLLAGVAPGVLTVSNIADFSRRGGMVEFVLAGNKVRFSVNLTPATEAGLTVSSDLLRVALTVRGNSPPRR
jgi:hypothetical protein